MALQEEALEREAGDLKRFGLKLRIPFSWLFFVVGRGGEGWFRVYRDIGLSLRFSWGLLWGLGFIGLRISVDPTEGAASSLQP